MFGRIWGEVDAYRIYRYQMDKNPFSIYDFMGYLFPGIITLFFIQLIWDGNENSIFNILNIENFEGITNNIEKSINLETTVICVVIAYVIGHIIAYLSSVTVEYFANKTFGYPSEYLMDSTKQSWWQLFLRYYFNVSKEEFHEGESKKQMILRLMKKKIIWRYVIGRLLWRFTIGLILFPLSFMTFTLGFFLGINRFITRPLDKYLIAGIKEKFLFLTSKIGIQNLKEKIRCDYHRVVMHYVYYNLPVCQNKTDNYISLYGFLRSICFILNGMFIFINIKILPTLDINDSLDEKKVWTWSILFTLSYISFLAFVKFYRRFTLENYMIMLTERVSDKSLESQIK